MESFGGKKIANIYITYQKLAKEKRLPEFFYLDALIIEINDKKAIIRRYQIWYWLNIKKKLLLYMLKLVYYCRLALFYKLTLRTWPQTI